MAVLADTIILHKIHGVNTVKERWGRGLSPVIGVSLLLVITILLAVVLILLSSGFSATQPATLASVEIDTDQRTAFVEMNAVDGNTEELEIVVNGDVQRTWTDFSAGNRIPLFCLRPGDDITVRQRNDDGRTLLVAQHEMQERSACRFDVTNDGTTETVSPINWRTGGDSVSQFYSYPGNDGDHGHLPPDFVQEDTSYIFFYEFQEEVALIFVHDSPQAHSDDAVHDEAGVDPTTYSDTGGGAVDMRIRDYPDGSEWVIQDDPSDIRGDRCDSAWLGAGVTEAGFGDACWGWTQSDADGGAIAGGFSGDLSGLRMTIDARWDSSASDWGRLADPGEPHQAIDRWQFVYRDTDGDIQTVDLAKDETVTIEIADAP